jgi:hypothetical protein
MMRAAGLTVLFILVVAAIVYVLPGPPRKPAPAAPAEFAPLVPENETPVAADEAFRDACFKSLPSAWVFTDMLFTQSKAWGLVLRADYTTPDVEGPNVNRVICSRGADGKTRVNVTMGQTVPPRSEK